MFDRRIRRAAGLVALVGLTGGAAFGAKLGHAGNSAKGANSTQTSLNLISDPTDAVSGVTTDTYDPSVLTLQSVTPEPGYIIDSFSVQTTDSGSGAYVTYNPAFSGGQSISPTPDEAGAVQVQWSTDPNSETGPTTVTDPSGDTGDLTFFLTFVYTAGEGGGQAQFDASMNGGPAFMTTLSTVPYPGTASSNPDGTLGSGSGNSLGDFPSVANGGFGQDQYTDTEGVTYAVNPTGDQQQLSDDSVDASDNFDVTQNYEQSLPEPSCLALLGVSGTLLLRRNRRVI